jgi:uncharacterized protein (DUF1501 family)
MPPNNPISPTRRVLLKRAAQLGILGAGAPFAMNLASMGEAAAFNSTDYRALVCIFFYGGNDYANSVVPYDLANYDLYSAIRGGGAGRTRGGIAYGRNELAATALTPSGGQVLTDNLQYALAPTMPRMKQLFDAGRLAVQLNVGPLVVPLTLAQFNSSNRALYPLPPKLFSHNDQQSVWQALGSEGATIGWGGRMGDLALSSNSNSLLTCISATGNAVFVSGRNALQYQISTSGAIRINALAQPPYGSTAIRDALNTLITANRTHVLENEFTTVTRRSIQMEGIVNGALNNVALTTPFDTDGTPNPLANQMQIVARLIGARTALGSRRQVFFVSLGGFDNHNLLMQDHPTLMARVDEAIGAFYQATVELGVADKVTTITASDFGRTLASNSDGSDHGWGGHHFVVGGAVSGGRFYGTAPHVSISSDDQVGQGRLLPSTAVDQYAATLARWFGVAESELPTVLPNIGNFSNTNVGFV